MSLSKQELENIGKLFSQLDVKPKLDTKEDLERWMMDYAASKKEDASPSFTYKVAKSEGMMQNRPI